MAVTRFQAEILKLIASSRVAKGESYIAGGLALNYQLRRPRLSSDIDVFNNMYDALKYAAESDRGLLKSKGYDVVTTRDRDWIVDAEVRHGDEVTEIQWVMDSAFRFFPLVTDDLLGYTLHPFDLATNKLLALVGREVPRDWVDIISCCETLQPLAYLMWAANGKDQGITPAYILEMTSRVRYTQIELDKVIRSEERVDAATLSRKWHEMLRAARHTITLLPPDEVGKAVLDKDGNLFRGTDEELEAALKAGEIIFHEGTIRGAWPVVRVKREEDL